VVPYAQNLTLQSHEAWINTTIDLRYVGTLARKQRSAANKHQYSEFPVQRIEGSFDAIRNGGESAC